MAGPKQELSIDKEMEERYPQRTEEGVSQLEKVMLVSSFLCLFLAAPMYPTS